MVQPLTPPKFFITHSHNDNEFAKRLCDDLRAAGLDGFFDVYSIRAGDDIAGRIGRGLEECDVYVPVLSPAALSSPWCEREINAAINLSMERDRGGRPRIIPVIAEECAIPVLLRPLPFLDFVGRYDDTFDELLVKGFGLPARSARVTFSTRPASALPRWLLVAGAGVLIVLILSLLRAGDWLQPTFTPSPVLDTRPTETEHILVGVATAMRTPELTATPHYTPTPHAGEEYLVGGAIMVFVPSGEFLMGSTEKDIDTVLESCGDCKPQWFDPERPQHTVHLNSFWIDKYLVTNKSYKLCVETGNCQLPADSKSYTRNYYYGNTTYDDYPVINVSWKDASTYCSSVGKQLPTEAQWEKATRGPDGLFYPWGNTWDKTRLNSTVSKPRPGDTTAVGSYPGGVSPYGAMDMLGNVWEWVSDWYDANYYSNSPQDEPRGPSSGQARVVRGGSWIDVPYQTRASFRFGYTPDTRNSFLGFRCAL